MVNPTKPLWPPNYNICTENNPHFTHFVVFFCLSNKASTKMTKHFKNLYFYVMQWYKDNSIP